MKTSNRIGTGRAALLALLVLGLFATALQASPAGAQTPTCESATTDPDGDGWGFENGRSCRVPTGSESSESSESSGNSGASNGSSSGTPTCASAATDPDGDGWGYENGRSCRVSVANNAPQQSDLVQAIQATLNSITNVTPWIPAGSTCSSLPSFQNGCDVSGGEWTSAFADFANQNGISRSANVGAQVQYFPSGSQPLENVIYIVGPYLSATDEANDDDNVSDERETVRGIVPELSAVESHLATLNVSVVYIGFGNLEDSEQGVEQRVKAVKDSVRAFETRREATLRHEPEATALIGLSIGGVAAKIALVELEDDGFDHGVDTYISFDSPHFGAYAPPGLQHLPVFLEGAFGWADGNFPFFIDDFEDAQRDARGVSNLLLRSPLAQDTLLVNAAYDYGSPNFSYLRDRYRDLPSSRNVAIASGSITGQGPNLGDRYFSVDTGDATAIDVRLEIDAKIPRVGDNAGFYGKLSHKAFVLDGWIPEYKTIYFERNPRFDDFLINEFEHAPCAHSTALVDDVVAQLNVQLNKTWSGVNIRPIERRACFIPTFSAIIGETSANGTPVGATAFDLVIGDATNKQHLHMSEEMVHQLTSELDAVFR